MRGVVRVEFKHYGWFFICPMAYGRDNNGNPYWIGRNGFHWLFKSLEFIYIKLINIIGFFNNEYTPKYRHISHGELKKPFYKYMSVEG